MATRQSIELDFRQAQAQADRIDGVADRLSRLSGGQFGATMQNLSANWKGENASGYLSKGARLQEKMNGTANELRSTAGDIRRVARALYEAEMRALEIAETRNN